MPAVTAHRIGRARRPVVVIDDFATGRLTVTDFFSIETQGALDVATP
jgi:hypothetical protein